MIKQNYHRREDEAAHFTWAQRAFKDPRHQWVDGKPMFGVFFPIDLPNTAAFLDHWRELAHKAGCPGLHLVAMTDKCRDGVNRYRNAILIPIDAVIPHPPHDFLQNRSLPPIARLRRALRRRHLSSRVNGMTSNRWLLPIRHDFAHATDQVLHDLPDEMRSLPAVLSGWDNTLPSGTRGMVFENATPQLFKRYLAKASDRVRQRPQQHRITFLKAWIEWAAGNVSSRTPYWATPTSTRSRRSCCRRSPHRCRRHHLQHNARQEPEHAA